MKLKKLAHLIALIGVVGPAVAQEAPPQQTMQRVEITGSSIKRIVAEGAMPVQLISREDIARSGITSAEQLVATLSANGTGADNMTANQGGDFLSGIKAHNNGASGASLRGLGSSSTLVLLNGRRIATHGLNGQSVDLNSIPLAAVQRVEVLKDGASAIYGTDAIGGVINFILRKDYRGAELNAFIDKTEQGGGDIYRTSLLVGTGALDTEGYNLMASVTVDRNTRLSGSERSFHNGYQPARGLAPDTTGAPYANLRPAAGTAVAANFPVTGAAGTYSRFNLLSQQGKCDSVPGMNQYQAALWGNPALAKACAYDYGSQWILMQPLDRVNLVSRATFKVNEDTQAFIEVNGSHTKSRAQYTPIQVAFTYPAGGAYYQDYSAYIPTFDKTKGERLQWRCLECGPRTQETTTSAYRVLGGLEGLVGGWDYKTGLSMAGSKAETVLNNGYVYNTAFLDALGTGKINPFLLPGQSQTQEATDLLKSVAAFGPLYGGSTSLVQLDGVLSKDLFKLPAGPLAAAVGFDLRRETYKFDDAIYHTGKPLVNGVGSGPALSEVKRKIAALYAELSVPVIKDMDLQLAVRTDHYSDFGNTTNPKIALRYQPIKQLVLRGSANRGFHAPDYDALYSGETLGLLNNFASDPACPTTPGANCRDKWDTRSGGNPNLKPERSKQVSIGVVLAPVDTILASVDLWKIKRTDRVVSLDAVDILNNYATLGGNVARLPNGEIDYIRAGYINAAGDEVSGADVAFSMTGKLDASKWDVAFDGTYINSFKTRLIDGQPWQELVGTYNKTDLQLRWKHQLRFTWTGGAWSTSVTQNYKAGYKDQSVAALGGIPPAGFNPDVKSYTLYNLSTTYTVQKGLTVSAGIKNLLNTDPPFSSHNIDEVAGAGWDSRVGDPRGRAYTLGVNYKFM
ncbi:MAG: TonB-dependent receptor [Pseudomonadota bacterium]|nr:TonB-dependent receptor [Pseudomonadota bacterium]